MNFGKALEAAKAGELITRVGWTDSSSFAFIRPEDDLPIALVVNTVKSIPQSVKDYLANQQSTADTKIHFTGYMCLYTAWGNVENGWLPSQADLIAEDWFTITP